MTIATDNVRNVAQMMNCAALALQERDVDALERLQSLSRNWLQDGSETAAQSALLCAMIDAACELQDFEAS